jgi:hypothetical protein
VKLLPEHRQCRHTAQTGQVDAAVANHVVWGNREAGVNMPAASAASRSEGPTAASARWCVRTSPAAGPGARGALPRRDAQWPPPPRRRHWHGHGPSVQWPRSGPQWPVGLFPKTPRGNAETGTAVQVTSTAR